MTDELVTVTLDNLVPANHFYRHLDAHLDLSFIREWVADAYPSIGRPSVDPVVVFKLYLGCPLGVGLRGYPLRAATAQARG